MIEGQSHWQRINPHSDYVETRWKPKSWVQTHRFDPSLQRQTSVSTGWRVGP
jgi:hypothetical protein